MEKLNLLIERRARVDNRRKEMEERIALLGNQQEAINSSLGEALAADQPTNELEEQRNVFDAEIRNIKKLLPALSHQHLRSLAAEALEECRVFYAGQRAKEKASVDKLTQARETYNQMVDEARAERIGIISETSRVFNDLKWATIGLIAQDGNFGAMEPSTIHMLDLRKFGSSGRSF